MHIRCPTVPGHRVSPEGTLPREFLNREGLMRGCPARSRKLEECWDPPTLPVTRSQSWLETSEIYLFQPGPGQDTASPWDSNFQLHLTGSRDFSTRNHSSKSSSGQRFLTWEAMSPGAARDIWRHLRGLSALAWSGWSPGAPLHIPQSTGQPHSPASRGAEVRSPT